MNNAQEIKENEIPANVLPQDQSMALNMLIRLTQNLSNLADRESTALAQNDMLAFAILQDEKSLVTQQYMKASEEFRSNINVYRGAEPGLLNRLERLQKDLGEKTSSNNNVVNSIYSRAQARTQSSLLTAQELGQDHRIEFESDEKDAVNENQTSARKAGA